MLLDLNTQTTSRLGLEPIKSPDGKGYLFAGGVVPAKILGVSVVMQKHEKGEFAGKEVPTLAIEFGNFKLTADEPDRFYTYYLKVVGSKEKIEGSEDQYKDRKAEDVISDNTNLWKSIKHFLENLVGSPNYRNVNTIPQKDVEDNFDLPILGSADVRLEKYSKFFKYIASFVNGDGNEVKSMILDAKGEGLNLWVKLLPNYDSDPKRKNKFYAISRFIGQGVFEPMTIASGKPISPRIIRIKPTESLELSTGAVVPAGVPGAAGHAGGAVDDAVSRLLAGGN